ncbi:MAG: HNH endonuclease [Promethearchaeota archaeon]
MANKSYFSEDYLPMKEKELDKAGKEFQRDLKKYAKSLKGFGIKKKFKAYREKRMKKYLDVAWDYQLDLFTQIYIGYSQSEDGKGTITVTVEENGDMDYILKDKKQGWDKIKEEAYQGYLKCQRNTNLSKETIFENILKNIEYRVPLILNLLKEKPRTRHIPAKVRYEVYQRDGGKCVVCGSNMNIEFGHIIHFSEGGSHTAENIKIFCQKCNRKRRYDKNKS